MAARLDSILYIDDDDDDLELFKAAVRDEFSQVTISSIKNGLDMQKYLQQMPDIIFLDINMPGKNGIECLKEIRSQKKFDKIPVIILSTSSRTEDIIASYTNGANIFVTKPFRYEQLSALIKGIISFYRN